MKIIKAHCAKHDKWFKIAVDDSGQVVNFEGVSAEAAKACQTQAEGTSFETSEALRPCMTCGSRRVGRCSHVEQLGYCGLAYSFQCLYCDQLRISLVRGDPRYGRRDPIRMIDLTKRDQYGNFPEEDGLAENDEFKGYKIVILCIHQDFNQDGTESDILRRHLVPALRRKGFEVTVISPENQDYFDGGSHVDARALSSLLGRCTQLWIVSGAVRGFDADSAPVVENFYKSGGGLFLWGDNDSLHADADFFGERLFGVSMSEDGQGEQTPGVMERGDFGSIIPGHPVSAGIAHFYEGTAFAAVRTNSQVRPLVYSSDGKVIMAYSESNGSRFLIGGGFTRLCRSWHSSGASRFVTNCAAWLADAQGGSEVCFT